MTVRSDETTLAVVVETTQGTTPTDPDLQLLRFASESLAPTATHIASGEINPGRVVTDSIRSGLTTGGSIDGEMSFDEGHEIMMAAAFHNDWAGNVLDIGATPTYLTIEKRIGSAADGGPFDHVYKGSILDGLSMSVSVGAVNTLGYTVLGYGDPDTVGVTIGAGSRIAAGANSVMHHAGTSIALAGDLLPITSACATEVSLTLTNSSTATECIGEIGSQHTAPGQAAVEGTLTVLFTSNDGMTAFLDPDNSFSLTVICGDGSNAYNFVASNCRLKGRLNNDAAGPSLDVPQGFEFDCIPPSAGQSPLTIIRSS